MRKLMRNSPSIRLAAAVIVSTTTLVVVLSAVLIRLLDDREFPNIWLSLWWSVQTVTTVGYGDVTPHDVAGRIVGGFVMLEGTALIAVITALITSTFVARAQHEFTTARLREGTEPDTIEGRLEMLNRKLDQIQEELRANRGPDRS